MTRVADARSSATEPACPRCGAQVRLSDRYCWNCGKRQPTRQPPSDADPGGYSVFVVVMLLGPVFGALVGLAVAETLIAEWPADVPEIVVMLVLVGVGAAIGGPLLVSLLERAGIGTNRGRPPHAE